jgi:hypothetical protein
MTSVKLETINRAALDALTRERSYAEIAIAVADDELERAAFRRRRAAIAVQEARSAVRGGNGAS